MRGGVATLAVRPAEIVVALRLIFLDDTSHEAEDLLDSFRSRLRHHDRAGRMQAVHDDQAAVHSGSLDGFFDLGPDIDGLAADLARHHEALALNEEISLDRFRAAHEPASRSAPASARTRTDFKWLVSIGLGK